LNVNFLIHAHSKDRRVAGVPRPTRPFAPTSDGRYGEPVLRLPAGGVEGSDGGTEPAKPRVKQQAAVNILREAA